MDGFLVFLLFFFGQSGKGTQAGEICGQRLKERNHIFPPPRICPGERE